MSTDEIPSFSSAAQGCNSLSEVRASVDAIDDQIVDLIALRAGYVARAATFKRDRDEGPAPDRVRLVLERVRRRAMAMSLPAEIIEATYRAMIAAFVAWEVTRIGVGRRPSAGSR